MLNLRRLDPYQLDLTVYGNMVHGGVIRSTFVQHAKVLFIAAMVDAAWGYLPTYAWTL